MKPQLRTNLVGSIKGQAAIKPRAIEGFGQHSFELLPRLTGALDLLGRAVRRTLALSVGASQQRLATLVTGRRPRCSGCSTMVQRRGQRGGRHRAGGRANLSELDQDSSER